MSTKRAKTHRVIGGALVCLISLVGIFIADAWAAHDTNKEESDYSDSRPWFDGKPFPYFLDMFNQPSIKPQEEGTFQAFPTDSVPRSGLEPFIELAAMVDGQLQRDLVPTNPTTPTADSITRGRVLYEVYCAVCHGKEGNAGTPVTLRGMPAPPIQFLLPVLSDAHLYNKIRLGGPIMPAYGFQTSQGDRWDMVNYMKSADFGKDTSQQ